MSGLYNCQYYFGGFPTRTIVEYTHPKPCSNYEGPYKTQVAPFLEGALKVSDAAAPVFVVLFWGVFLSGLLLKGYCLEGIP